MAQVRLRSRQASDAASVRNRSSNLAALRALSQRLLPSANLPNGSTEVHVGVSKPPIFMVSKAQRVSLAGFQVIHLMIVDVEITRLAPEGDARVVARRRQRGDLRGALAACTRWAPSRDRDGFGSAPGS